MPETPERPARTRPAGAPAARGRKPEAGPPQKWDRRMHAPASYVSALGSPAVAGGAAGAVHLCGQRAEWQTARELGEHLLTLAQRQFDPVLLLAAHAALGGRCSFVGEAGGTRHLARGVRWMSRPPTAPWWCTIGLTWGMFARCYAALSLWLLGAPAQALAQVHEARTLAQDSADPYSLACVLLHVTRLYQWRRDVPATLTWARP